MLSLFLYKYTKKSKKEEQGEKIKNIKKKV